MIPASRSVKTMKKIINLPDPMVLDIDRLAIGDYSKRSGFVESAIRIYRRDLYRLYGELSMAAQSSDMSLEEALMKQHDSLMKQLQEDYERFERYESDDVTAIGISLTDELLRGVDAFIDKEGPVRNLQMFARLAVARELEIYERSTPKKITLLGRDEPNTHNESIRLRYQETHRQEHLQCNVKVIEKYR